MKTCSICKGPYEGHGNNPRPLLTAADRCCDSCNDAVIIPLRMARIVALEGANRVAEFARMLAFQRVMLPPQPTRDAKEMALIAATGMIANAVEGLWAAMKDGNAR